VSKVCSFYPRDVDIRINAEAEKAPKLATIPWQGFPTGLTFFYGSPNIAARLAKNHAPKFGHTRADGAVVVTDPSNYGVVGGL